MNVLPWLPGGQICITSSIVFGWKLAANHSRASRSFGSRRSSYSLNNKLACSCVTSPMVPPLDLLLGCLLRVSLGSKPCDERAQPACRHYACHYHCRARHAYWTHTPL